ncbi:hypothetical protein GCM10010909_18900 [Acidocella aquatica]|uniref:Mlr4354 like protein n=2 Tax=Acidocella aquatica TaxID=1922313 RepID=A0ABQ6A400_9PROT|nr:hypothetical protein GCM10010909_18900 [Acidocella aquatica]
MSGVMKYLGAALIFLIPAIAAAADGPVALGGNGGKFGDWTAAAYGTGSAKICYAFTTAQTSKPSWKSRGPVMLTVTERTGSRDEVTLSAGYTYPAKPSVTLAIGTTKVDFYTQGGTAFTASGGETVAAFKNGAAAEAISTGPHGHPVTDDFSLTGFSGAYNAIVKACP